MPDTGTGSNLLVITGQVIEMSALRHTPAGVPVASFKFRHESRLSENEILRDVVVELEAVAIGSMASLVKTAGLASGVKLTGFLAQKSLRNAKPVLHVEKIEFLEGQ